jgi:HEAT repeat protein
MSLSSLIVQREVATIRQVEEALARQVLYGGDLVTNLLEVAEVPESVLVLLLAETLHIPNAPVGALPLPNAAARALVPAEVAIRRSFSPLQLTGDTLFVAVAEPLEQYVKAELSFALGVQIEERVAPLVRIREALAAAYDAPLDRRMERLIARLAKFDSAASTDRPPMLASAPPASVATVESETSPLSPHPTPALGSIGVARSTAPPIHGTHVGFPAPAPPSEPAPDPRLAEPAPPVITEAFPRNAPPQVHPSSLIRVMDRVNHAPRSARRRRGPLTFDRAKVELEQASERDTLLDLFFDFSLQFFEYTALFVVHGDIAEGRDAYGPGAPRERVVGVGVPLDLPSAFSAARDRSAPVIARPGSDGLDAVLVQDLRRMVGWPILVVPIVVRGRTVALLYGDNGDAGVDGTGSGEVTAFASRVGQSFERIIVRRKLGGFVADKSTLLPRVDPLRVAAKAKSEAPTTAAIAPSGPAPANASSSSEPRVRRFTSPPVHETRSLATNSWEESMPTVATEFGELPPPPQVVAIRRLSIQPIPREEPESLNLDLTPGPGISESMPSIEAHGLDEVDEAQLLRELEELDPAADGESSRIDGDITAEPLPLVPRSSKAIAISAHTPPSAYGRPESLPSVIVNVDSEFLALVDRLVSDAHDEHAEAELLRQGQHAMPAIMARFPGPTTLALSEVAERGPRVGECGPILRLIAGQRRVALPFVLAQVDDPDVNRRFWATFLLTELSYPEAVPAIVARLFDEHEPTRRVARLAAKMVAEGAREAMVAELDRIVRDPQASQGKRIATMDTLAEMRNALVVPVLIGALGDDVESVALAARRALMVVVRQDFGRDTRRWLAWWSSNSSRHRIEWLIDALTHDHSPMRRAAAEELKAITKEFFGYYEDLPRRERERAQQRYRDWWRSEGRARFRRS